MIIKATSKKNSQKWLFKWEKLEKGYKWEKQPKT